jgi:hypothetical protein
VKDCKQCQYLICVYKLKAKEAKTHCWRCKCQAWGEQKKTERVVYQILESFAAGHIFHTPVNPREVAGKVWELEKMKKALKNDKTDLAEAVKLCGLSTSDLPAELIGDVVKDTVTVASAAKQRQQLPPLDHHVWMGVEKPPEIIRMPGSWRAEAEEQKPKTTVKIKLDNKTGIEAAATEGEEKGRRYMIFEYNVTSVLRWMGKDGWTFKQARRTMDALGLPVADATLNAQLRAGVKGERGDPADLDEDEQAKLRRLGMEDVSCTTSSQKISPVAPTAEMKLASKQPKRSTQSSSTSTATSVGKNTTSKEKIKNRKKNKRKSS